jgi:hypothetical protein
MRKNGSEAAEYRPAGYAALIERYGLDVIPNWHQSLVATSGTRRIDLTAGMIEEVYPSKYWPGDSLGDQLEFALKYDGTNLAILASLFPVPTSIRRWQRSNPPISDPQHFGPSRLHAARDHVPCVGVDAKKPR